MGAGIQTTPQGTTGSPQGGGEPSFGIQLGQSVASQAANGIVGSLMGLMLEKHNDERQINQQKALTDIQYQANERMAEANYQRQLDLWHATNYGAQMKEIKAAGLNPALLYGTSGGGGTTAAAAQGQGVSGGSAPQYGGGEIMGLMNMSLQNQMLQSQINLNNSQAEKNKADAAYTSGAQTDVTKSQTTLNIAATGNTEADTKIKEVNEQLQKVQLEIQGQSAQDIMATIRTNSILLSKQLEQLTANTRVDQATVQTRIDSMKQQLVLLGVEQSLKNANIKNLNANTALTQEQIQQVITNIKQSWNYLTVAERNADANQQGAEANLQNASTNANRLQLDRWLHDVSDQTRINIELLRQTVGGIIQAVK